MSKNNITLLLQVEKKIAAELESHGLLATAQQPDPQAPDYNDLAKLTYLSCVIKESMRMHTVSPFTVCFNVYSVGIQSKNCCKMNGALGEC